MDMFLRKELSKNSVNYKSSLERIIEKYSKLQYHHGGVEVDLDTTNTQTLERYMKQSKAELSKLESKSPTDLREESMRVQDVTRDTQLDFTYEDSGGDETCVSSTRSYKDEDGTTSSDATQLTVSSLDESRRNVSETTEVQPEDQDEELEMTLRSRGSSLVELYPDMISRIGRAWRRQHVSEAADSVLRRYRRWRQQSNRSSLSNTFVVDRQRHARRNPKNILKETSRTPSRSPLKMVNNSQDWREQQESPGRARRDQPVLVMDFSEPKESFLNETFTVCEESSIYTSRPNTSLDQSLRSRRLSLPAHSTSEPVRDLYGSPVRPLQVRMVTCLSRSPHGFPRSPKAQPVESFSREPRLMSTPPQRTLHPHDSLRSPHSATEGRHRLRRHLSFDSSLPSFSPKKLDEEFLKLYHKSVCQNKSSFFNRLPCRLCARNTEAGRSPFSSSSSSALAALALSPHRSLLRKRHRELEWDSRPQSKRHRDEYCLSSPGSRRHRDEYCLSSPGSRRHRDEYCLSSPGSRRHRDEYCLSSPGSKRHRDEMLRRHHFSPSKYERSHDGVSYSSSRPAMFQRFSSQRRSADAHQETWMSPRRRRRVSAADYSDMGRSFESGIASSFSPRKW